MRILNERQRASARFRMQRLLPERVPTPRALFVDSSEHDRRRIPLEGRRKTEAWRAQQRFLQACEELEQRLRALSAPTVHRVYYIPTGWAGFTGLGSVLNIRNPGPSNRVGLG